MRSCWPCNDLPPYLLYFNVGGMLTFDGALVVVFIVALAVAARVVNRSGLGNALRIAPISSSHLRYFAFWRPGQLVRSCSAILTDSMFGR